MAEDVDAPAREPHRWLEFHTGTIAIIGGFLALAVSVLVTISVLGRWLFSAPINGDYEFVEIATAIGAFCYLPYTQARRGHIMVDTFTMQFSERTRNRIDAFWDLVYAAVIGFCSYALMFGTLDTLQNHQTTMQLQLVLWPSIALAALLCGIAALSGVATALDMINRPGRGGQS
jgi:TRAP-type C4-dicarboxylate transport system permease small subunit